MDLSWISELNGGTFRVRIARSTRKRERQGVRMRKTGHHITHNVKWRWSKPRRREARGGGGVGTCSVLQDVKWNCEVFKTWKTKQDDWYLPDVIDVRPVCIPAAAVLVSIDSLSHIYYLCLQPHHDNDWRLEDSLTRLLTLLLYLPP